MVEEEEEEEKEEEEHDDAVPPEEASANSCSTLRASSSIASVSGVVAAGGGRWTMLPLLSWLRGRKRVEMPSSSSPCVGTVDSARKSVFITPGTHGTATSVPPLPTSEAASGVAPVVEELTSPEMEEMLG